MKRRHSALIARRDPATAQGTTSAPDRIITGPQAVWSMRPCIYRVTVAAVENLGPRAGTPGQPMTWACLDVGTPIAIEVRFTRCGYYRARVQIGGAWDTITTGGSDSQDHHGNPTAFPLIAAAINEAFTNAGIEFFLDGHRQGFGDNYNALDAQLRAIVEALGKEAGNPWPTYGRVSVIGGVL